MEVLLFYLLLYLLQVVKKILKIFAANIPPFSNENEERKRFKNIEEKTKIYCNHYKINQYLIFLFVPTKAIEKKIKQKWLNKSKTFHFFFYSMMAIMSSSRARQREWEREKGEKRGGGGTCMKSVGTLVSEPKEKKQSHERDKEVSKSWSFNITSIHFFHAISYLCFNILLLGTITNLLAKNVGKVKGCLRWRHGWKEKKRREMYMLQSIYFQPLL